MIRRRFVLASTVLLVASAAQANSFDQIAREATAGAHTPTEMVRDAVEWTHAHMKWTYTDYKTRTADEIIARGGGNCMEQAVVVQAILDRAGVKNRKMREVNIQPQSADRLKGSVDLMRSRGLMASVFGYGHNDHVWIEYWDGEWQPADATIGIIGMKDWVISRMGFGARPHHDVVPFQDMLVPIGVTSVSGKEASQRFTDQTEHFLIDGFGEYVPQARASRSWPEWVKDVRLEGAHVRAAFSGQYDLHKDQATIEHLRAVYLHMRADATAPKT